MAGVSRLRIPEFVVFVGLDNKITPVLSAVLVQGLRLVDVKLPGGDAAPL